MVDTLPYRDRLKIAWFLGWRGGLASLILGAVFGGIVGLVFTVSGSPTLRQRIPPVSFSGGGLLGFFVVSP